MESQAEKPLEYRQKTVQKHKRTFLADTLDLVKADAQCIAL